MDLAHSLERFETWNRQIAKESWFSSDLGAHFDKRSVLIGCWEKWPMKIGIRSTILAFRRWPKTFFIFHWILLRHFGLCANTQENCFFQIESYSRVHEFILFLDRQRNNSLEKITCSEMGNLCNLHTGILSTGDWSKSWLHATSARMQSQLLKEFGLGATATCGACLFTNPLEVVKTRMQLQGELKARGTYARHYRNVFHAFYTIGRFDGLRSLQSGLAPALVYQAVMNGCRLGSYQVFTNLKLTANSEGKIEFWRCLIAGAVSGAIGAFFGSPAYMVSTETLLIDCIWGFQSKIHSDTFTIKSNFENIWQRLVGRSLRDYMS